MSIRVQHVEQFETSSPPARDHSHAAANPAAGWLDPCGCAGILGPVINLVKVNVGAGILSMPLCFLLVGYRTALLALFVFGAIGAISVQMMATVASRTGARSLEEATERLLGYGAGRILQFTMLLKCLGSMVAYLDVLGEVFPPLLAGWMRLPVARFAAADGSNYEAFGVPLMHGVEASPMLELRTLVIGGIAGFVLAPLSLLRSVNALSPGAALCLVLAVTLVLLVAAQSLQAMWQGTAAAHLAAGGRRPEHGSVQEGIRSVAIIVFAFACQHMIFPIHVELVKDSASQAEAAEKFGRLRKWTFCVVTLMYATMGYCGLAAFGTAAHPDVMENLPRHGRLGGFVRTVTALFSATLVFSFQFNVFAGRPSFDALLFAQRKDHSNPAIPLRAFVLEGLVLITMSAMTAIALPDISTVFALTGGTTCTSLMFFFPAALYYKATGAQERSGKVLCGLCAMLLVGVLIGVGSTIVVLGGAKVGGH